VATGEKILELARQAEILVNWFWYPAEEVIVGPRLNAKVCPLGGDWMTIRRDGVGVMDVRATLETSDGALISVNHLGSYERGENGYQDFLTADQLPTVLDRAVVKDSITREIDCASPDGAVRFRHMPRANAPRHEG
jgi:hypothetical protein